MICLTALFARVTAVCSAGLAKHAHGLRTSAQAIDLHPQPTITLAISSFSFLARRAEALDCFQIAGRGRSAGHEGITGCGRGHRGFSPGGKKSSEGRFWSAAIHRRFGIFLLCVAFRKTNTKAAMNRRTPKKD